MIAIDNKQFHRINTYCFPMAVSLAIGQALRTQGKTKNDIVLIDVDNEFQGIPLSYIMFENSWESSLIQLCYGSPLAY